MQGCLKVTYYCHYKCLLVHQEALKRSARVQVALKFEHRSSKGCNYGPPYEWSVYRSAPHPVRSLCGARNHRGAESLPITLFQVAFRANAARLMASSLAQGAMLRCLFAALFTVASPCAHQGVCRLQRDRHLRKEQAALQALHSLHPFHRTWLSCFCASSWHCKPDRVHPSQ